MRAWEAELCEHCYRKACWGCGASRRTSRCWPRNGVVVHAWTREEPYIELKGTVTDVRAAANGEVMSVAHGLEEEVILRIRHEGNTETLYGNLAACYVDVGDYVFEGDIVATVLEGKPLAFELRKDGRSIDPKGKLKSPEY